MAETGIDQADVTRAVAVLNAAIKHKMAPEGCIPESDGDKILEAERILASAKQAHAVAMQVGRSKVPTYDAIVSVLAEGEVFLGIGSAEHEEAAAAASVAQTNGSAAPTLVLPSAPPPSGEESASAGSKESAPPPAVGSIAVVDKPYSNERIYTHEGCEGGQSSWVVPLDDCPPPASGSTRECSNCAYIAPVISHVVAVENSFLPPPSLPSPSSPSPTSPPSSVAFDGPPPPAAVPTGPASSPEPAQPPQDSSSESSSGQQSTEPDDDDESDPLYRAVLDQVEVDYSPSGMPVPQELETPPEGMPDDLTANEVANRRLHSQFNALASRARRLYTIEHAKARGCKRVLERSYLPPAMRKARQELGKDATVTEVRQLAEQDPQVLRWLERMESHADRADAYKHFFEIYTENVAVLSRDLTWSETEGRGA